ncbi:DNA repair protein rhp57 [Aspergillus udagawae]|uniref:DNA repair protein rhp57 n=1 Tax=Aspergillus udagawae TaxID=91492 RepID=A0A8E0V4F7_9EURO|nr:uncharacterized protein Aud_008313 [Aspergillus udagawae]GFF87828.1 DNA repair protein rhp57 [Aspergillus udagawae]GFG24627.1 DNA repair protein rhp57 [Aspergillus udagawae]GIC91859.1 hypothetical protein Aud_008313 [Aspergillus udagawae]
MKDMKELEPLQKIGQDVYLHEGSAYKSNESKSDPSLIILCTWLGGASPRRINKYVAQYRFLFPTSSILLITTTLPDITIRPFSVLRARLKPARDAICHIFSQKAGNTTERKNDALLHVFSNGGCNTAIQLALSMKANSGPDALHRLPLRGVIFDCCPGQADFRRSYNAAVLSLPQGGKLVQLVGRGVLYTTVGTITSIQNMGLMSSVNDLRHQLNDEGVLGRHVRRLYMCSQADTMVDWRDVLSHMETAQEQGYQANGVMFRDSPHCALMLEDEKKYWTSIKEFWREEDLSYRFDGPASALQAQHPQLLIARSQRVVIFCSLDSVTLMDLLSVLPGFKTRPYAHIIPPLERNKITIVDLITLDNLEIAKRAHVPPADLRQLTTQVLKALHKDVGFEEACESDDAVEPSSSNDIEKPLIPGPSTKLDLSRWNAISTLDPVLDELLNGGLPTGYLTEVTGESGSGKTQFLLSLLLAVQLPEPRGLGKRAIYISTEAPLATSRLSQLLEYHPYLSTLPKDRAPTLENIHSINAMDLETQDHILNYQLPVAITRYDVGLVVVDSITSNYRAEHTSHNVLGLSTRSGELARLGQMLRNLAVAKNIAIVVANQVSDRFDPLESNPALRRAAAYGHTIVSSSPVSTQQQQTTPLHRESAVASPLPAARSRPPESGNAELSPHITIVPPSSSPTFPSSPFVADDNQSEQQQQQDFDGSYLIGNPVRNELLSLVHQQRFFTGWGDTPKVAAPPSPYYLTRQPPHKTPALGFVWSSQIACRIALKKEEITTMLDPAFEPKSTDPLASASQPHEGTRPTPNSKEHRSDHPVLETSSEIPPVSRRTTLQPAAPDTIPPRTLRRTMKLVFAPWTAGVVTTTVDKEGNSTVYIQDEVEYTIWKGGLKSVEGQE